METAFDGSHRNLQFIGRLAVFHSAEVNQLYGRPQLLGQRSHRLADPLPSFGLFDTIARVGLTLAIDLGAGWMAGPSLSYSQGNAQGDDYDFRGWAVALQVSTPELSGFKVVVLVSYGEDNYDNPNSLLGFTEERVDQPFAAKVTITFKQIEKWLGYAPTVSVGYVRHDSNITQFDYSRWTPEIEVSLGVLSF